nr:hypothetical protein [Pseudomonadota bacterium]
GEDSGPLSAYLGLSYEDECFLMSLSFERSYTNREDIESGDTILLRLSFKNLGEVTSPLVSRSVLREASRSVGN